MPKIKFVIFTMENFLVLGHVFSHDIRGNMTVIWALIKTDWEPLDQLSNCGSFGETFHNFKKRLNLLIAQSRIYSVISRQQNNVKLKTLRQNILTDLQIGIVSSLQYMRCVSKIYILSVIMNYTRIIAVRQTKSNLLLEPWGKQILIDFWTMKLVGVL